MIDVDSKLEQISITLGYEIKLASCNGIGPPAAEIVIMLPANVSKPNSTQG